MPDLNACRNGTVTLKLAVLHSDLYFTENLNKSLQQKIFIKYYRSPAPENLLVLQNTFSDASTDEEYLGIQCQLQWKSMEQVNININDNYSISSFSIFLSLSMYWNLKLLKLQEKGMYHTFTSHVSKQWYFFMGKVQEFPILTGKYIVLYWVLYILILG